jgi:dipeptidyl aminopeptidase/acylaminoacyl peptidase
MIARMIRACILTVTVAGLAAGQTFTLEHVTSYPFPNELAAAATGSHIAWAVNERGRRNLYVAAGPAFTPRKVTNYGEDDGQELTSVQLSHDGYFVVYVRGGDHGANWDPGLPVNPAFSATPPKVQIWSVAFSGGEPRLIGEGDHPVISPDGATVAFVRGGQAFTASMDGTTKAAKALFTTRGTVSELEWSPDSTALAFTANRGDHSFIGVYREGKAIEWIAAAFTRDHSPQWSPDGKRIAFVRTAGAGGAPRPLLERTITPWSIWTCDAAACPASAAKKIWDSPKTQRGSAQRGAELHWAALGRIVFSSYQDGWPHLYSIPENGGGEALLLTPGAFEVEQPQLSADGKSVIFHANAGPDKLDVDRRHVVRAAVDKSGIEVLTPGDGIEVAPVLTGDGATIAYLSATTSQPAVLAVRPAAGGGAASVVGAFMIPAELPASQLIVPKQVIYKSSDGVTVHAQLFDRQDGGGAKKPGIVFVHGGPSRQMLLGWHYMDYYTNSYAMNQYLASRGFVVLSVNYRLGIGYGHDFQRPKDGGSAGASEYLDVKAGGEWLAKQPQVDASRIGIYGGSYGGFLTAMALAKDSKLFAAGVDIHGVHDWTQMGRINAASDRFEKIPDADKAMALAFKSSPVAWVSGWKSPVLFIHGDDDRNVRFNQSIDLIRRLDTMPVALETLVIVDDTHHMMRHANQLRVDEAIAEFMERKLKLDSSSVSAPGSK